MPRTARASAANLCYHVLNRGNNRASVFHKDGDFDAFVDLLAEAKLRNPMRILAYCVLPNHFHLALWPLGDGDLGRWMHSMRSAERTVRYRPMGSQDRHHIGPGVRSLGAGQPSTDRRQGK